MSLFFANFSLVEVTYLLISFNKTKFSVMEITVARRSSNLTEQSFLEICRNDQLLNETIWNLDDDEYSANTALGKTHFLFSKTTCFL